MLKVIAEFEAKVNDKVGRFHLDQDTPLPVAKEMCFQFIKYIGQIEDQIIAEQKKQQEEKKAKQEEKIEALNG